jgi:hypothetical protein
MAAEVAVVIKAKDQTKGVFGGIQRRLGGLAKVAKTAFIGVGAGVAIAGAAITKFAIDAAKVEQSRNTFDKLSQSVGDTLPKALDKMQRATRGMVADQDLFLAGNRFLNMGLAETTDQAAELSEMGSQLALAMGGEATQGMEDFALMLANQSLPRLDTFGISSGRVRTRILELMAADKSLTREMAFTAAVMEEGSKAMERVGEQGEGAAAEYAKFKTVLTNLKTEVGRAFLPIMTKLLSKVLIPTAKWLAQRLVPWMGKFSGILERLVTKVGRKLGPFIEMFRKLGTIFGIIQEEGIADFFQNFGDILGDFFVGRVGRTAYAIQTNLIEPFTTLYRIIRQYGLADFFQNFGDIIGDVFVGKIGRAAYSIQSNLIDPLIRLGRKGKEAFDQVKGALVGVWQDHIFPNLLAISTGVETWWLEGGLGKTLSTISTGWSKMVEGLTGFYTDHIGPKLDLVKTWVGIWWSGMGGSQGILTKISEGWEKYIASPLDDFYNQHLSGKLANVGARISGWWASLTSGEGIMVNLSAMWNKYIAMPLENFYQEHLSEKLETLRTALAGWAGRVWVILDEYLIQPIAKLPETIETVRKKLKEIEKERPLETGGLLGFLNRGGAALETIVKGFENTAKTFRAWQKMPIEKRRGLLGWVATLWDLFKEVIESVKAFIKLKYNEAIVSIGAVAKGVEWLIDKYREARQSAIDAGRDPVPYWQQGRDAVDGNTGAVDLLQGAFFGFVGGALDRLSQWRASLDDSRRSLEALRGAASVPLPTPSYRSPGSYTPPGETPGLPAYDTGGVVPGPLGAPQLAVLHGGEEILTPRQRRRGGNYFDFRGATLVGIDQNFVEELFDEANLLRRLQGIRDSD